MNDNEQKINRSYIFDVIAKLVLISVAALVPIFFLPVTLEFFYFNKLALITVATLLMIGYWATKMLLGEKIGFVKSSLDLPILAYVLVVILATFFSISKTDSMFGSQGRWIGLFSTLVFVAYFFLSTPLLKDLKTVKTALFAFLATSTLSTVVSLLSYFGLYLGNADFLKTPNFSVAGSSSDTAMLAGLAIVIALGLIPYMRIIPVKIVFVASVAINYLYIALVGLPVGFAVLGAGIIGLLMYADVSKIFKDKIFYGITAILLAALTLVTLLPATRSVLINKAFVREPSLSLNNSWFVASSIIQNYPLLATGPSTFYLNYTKYRPLNLNGSEYWNVRFDMPGNEFFNILASLGIVGLIVALFLVAKIVRLINSAKVNQDQTGLTQIVSSVILAMLVGFFFIPASILSSFVMIFLLGAVIAIHNLVDVQYKFSESVSVSADALSSLAGVSEASVIKKEYFKYIVSVPLFIGIAYVGYISYRNYAGEYFMRQSLNAAARNDGKATYDLQRQAITFSPNRDAYQATYAQTNLAIANSMASRQDLTDTDKQTVQTLIAQAIRSARVASEVLGPLNASNWETRAFIYRSLINVAQNASDWTVGAYNTAIQLDPSNPRLRVDLGGVYFQMGDYLSAANQFRQATLLKGDYANAYYNFSNALVALKDYQNAKAALDITKSLVPVDSTDRKLVDALMETVDAQLAQVAGAASAKPTIEQISGSQGAIQKVQEPLTSPTEKQPITNEKLDLGKLPQTDTTQPAPKQ